MLTSGEFFSILSSPHVHSCSHNDYVRKDFCQSNQVIMSTLFSQKLVDTPSRLAAFFTVVISLLIIIGVNIINAKYNAVINRTLVFLLILLSQILN